DVASEGPGIPAAQIQVADRVARAELEEIDREDVATHCARDSFGISRDPTTKYRIVLAASIRREAGFVGLLPVKALLDVRGTGVTGQQLAIWCEIQPAGVSMSIRDLSVG